MVCRHATLAIMLPALLIPFVLVNLAVIPLLALRHHGHKKDEQKLEAEERQLAEQERLAALAAGATGETVVKTTMPGGVATTTVLGKGQSAMVPEGASVEVIASSKPGTKTVVKRTRHPGGAAGAGGGAAGGAAAGGAEVVEQIIQRGATTTVLGEPGVETIIIEEEDV